MALVFLVILGIGYASSTAWQDTGTVTYVGRSFYKGANDWSPSWHSNVTIATFHHGVIQISSFPGCGQNYNTILTVFVNETVGVYANNGGCVFVEVP